MKIWQFIKIVNCWSKHTTTEVIPRHIIYNYNGKDSVKIMTKQLKNKRTKRFEITEYKEVDITSLNQFGYQKLVLRTILPT